jgi:transcriptional antiterminator RfaH
MPAQWYVLHVKPHKERAVDNQLSTLEGVEHFFPSIRVTPKNPRAARVRPYFPGYLFVRLDLEALGTDALQWTPGVRGLVRFGDEPAPVPDHLVQELRKFLAELAKLGPDAGRQFKKGERVRVVSGPLEGLEGLFDMQLADGERVQILLTYLNDRYQRVKLDSSAIEKLK